MNKCLVDGLRLEHVPVDSGFKTSECKRCKCKMVYDNWTWTAVEPDVYVNDYDLYSSWVNPWYRISE